MAAATLSVDRKPDRPAVSPNEALAALLDQLTAVLLEIPHGVYVACPAPGVSGSIGSQVRHLLDHVAAFLAATATPSARLSYDHRERGTVVEVDSRAALLKILRLKVGLEALGASRLDQPVEVAASLSRDGKAVVGWSTGARELAFVVSHTIHHQAIIALLLVLQGIVPPANFGVAPSTPHLSPQ
jgi:uncharacterized damage-inducible protein DinB